VASSLSPSVMVRGYLTRCATANLEYGFPAMATIDQVTIRPSDLEASLEYFTKAFNHNRA